MDRAGPVPQAGPRYPSVPDGASDGALPYKAFGGVLPSGENGNSRAGVTVDSNPGKRDTTQANR